MKTIKVLMLILGLTLVVLGLAGVIFDVYDPVINKNSSTVILNLSNNDESV